MVCTTDDLYLGTETEAATLASPVMIQLTVLVCRAVGLRHENKIFLVIIHKSLDIRQVLDRIIFLDTGFMPYAEQDSKVFRDETDFQELSDCVKVLSIQIERYLRELSRKRAPQRQLFFVFNLAGLVDTDNVDLALGKLFRKVIGYLIDSMTQAPSVDRLRVDHARETVGRTHIARLDTAAFTTVDTGAYDVAEYTTQTLVGIVAHERGPSGDTPDLDVAAFGEMVLVGLRVEDELANSVGRRHNTLDFVEHTPALSLYRLGGGTDFLIDFLCCHKQTPFGLVKQIRCNPVTL